MAKTSKRSSTKKKQWINILAPAVFGEKLIGQAHVLDAQTLLGRKLKVNLFLLTNDIKKQSIHVKFKISEIKNNEAHTVVLGYQMSPITLKKVTRRNRNKINQSFIMKTKDGVNARIKTLIITSTKSSSVKLKQLQYVLLNEINEVVESKTYAELLGQFLIDAIQSKLRLKLDKIYPVRTFFVYYASISNAKKPKIINKEEISKIKVKVTRVIPRPYTPRRRFTKRRYNAYPKSRSR